MEAHPIASVRRAPRAQPGMHATDASTSGLLDVKMVRQEPEARCEG